MLSPRARLIETVRAVAPDSVLGNCMASSVKSATGTVIFGRMTVIDSDVNSIKGIAKTPDFCRPYN
jgi:hypothetical protein